MPSRSGEGVDATPFATRDEAAAALAPRFGGDGDFELIEAPVGKAHVLVTTLAPGDDSVAGQQILVVVEETSDGWRFAKAWERWLCHRGANGMLCL